MPFSKQLESQYKWLMRDKLNAVTFTNPVEMDQFYQALNHLVKIVEKKSLKDAKLLKDNKGVEEPHSKKFLILKKYENVLHELKDLAAFKNTNKTADIKEFKEMIEEGFDLYATDKIVDQVTQVRLGNDSNSPYIDVVAFVSIHDAKKDFKMTVQDKIKEARKEFERIMIEELKNKISQVRQMTFEQKQQIISNKNESRQNVESIQKKLKDSKEPSPEARTLTEEEWAEENIAMYNAQLAEQYREMQAQLALMPDLAQDHPVDFSYADLRGVNFTGVILQPHAVPRSVVPQVLFQNIPAEVKALALDTGINAIELKQMQDNKLDHYEKISNLRVYLKNANEGRQPALNRQQVLATTEQESKNLNAVIKLIDHELLTLEQAKRLTEDERLTICMQLPRANDIEDLRNIVYALNAIQAALNIG